MFFIQELISRELNPNPTTLLLADLDALLQEELGAVEEPRDVALIASLEVHQSPDEMVESVVAVERLSAVEEPE